MISSAQATIRNIRVRDLSSWKFSLLAFAVLFFLSCTSQSPFLIPRCIFSANMNRFFLLLCARQCAGHWGSRDELR